MKATSALPGWTVAVIVGTVAVIVGFVALVAPVGAQQTARIPRVGFLGTSPTPGPTLAFQRGLRDLGYVEGQNIVVEYRFSDGQGERLPELGLELIDLDPELIIAAGAIHAQALKQATTTIPVIFAIQPDAVAAGLVTNAARPGGNLTGFTNFDPDQAAKQLELLRELNPALTRVAILWDRD